MFDRKKLMIIFFIFMSTSLSFKLQIIKNKTSGPYEILLYLYVYFRDSTVLVCLFPRFYCTCMFISEILLYLYVYFRDSTVLVCLFPRFYCTCMFIFQILLYLYVYFPHSAVLVCLFPTFYCTCMFISSY